MLLEIKAEAEADLSRIYAFNVQRSFAWAHKVEQRLLARLRMLPQKPNVGRRFSDAGVYRVSVTDIQYVIDYEMFEDRVVVLRIQSTREIR